MSYRTIIEIWPIFKDRLEFLEQITMQHGFNFYKGPKKTKLCGETKSERYECHLIERNDDLTTAKSQLNKMKAILLAADYRVYECQIDETILLETFTHGGERLK